MSKKMRSNIMLLITAAIWGSAFVAQKEGGTIGAFTYNGIRMFIGGLVLIPLIYILPKLTKQSDETSVDDDQLKKDRNLLIIGGICCGLALFAGSTLQQFGVNFTTAGKAGFITSLYMVIVPILSIALGKKIRPLVWLCVIMGAVGLYLLCMKGTSFTLQLGDLFVLLCAFAFAVHIMVIDYFSPRCNGVKLSSIQFLVCGALGIICMFIFEKPNISAILSAWFPILYAGVCSCGIAYTLQVVAQADAEPTTASLLMSLESVFAVITGGIILGETMTPREYIGCIVIFAAVILSQLPSKEERLQAKAVENSNSNDNDKEVI